MTKTTINKQYREDMVGWTSSEFWSRPVCWSGIRNELEKLALQHEHAADYAGEPINGFWRNRSREESRLAKLADGKVN